MGCTPPKLEEKIEEYYDSVLISRITPKRFFNDIKDLKDKNTEVSELDNVYFKGDFNETKSFVSSFLSERKEVSIKDMVIIAMLLTDGDMDDKVRFIIEIDKLYGRSVDNEKPDSDADADNFYFTHIDGFKYSITKEKLLKLSLIYIDFISAHSLIRLHGQISDTDGSKEDIKLLHIKFDYEVRKGYINKYILNNNHYETDFVLFMEEKSKILKQDAIRRTMINEGSQLVEVPSS